MTRCRGAAAVLAGLAMAAALAMLAACGDVPTIDGAAPAWDPTYPVDSAGTALSVIYHWPLAYSIAIYVDTTATTPGRPIGPAIDRGVALWQGVTYYREIAWHLARSPEQADVIFHNVMAPMLVGTAGCLYQTTGFGGYTFLCPSTDADSMLTLPLVSGAPGHVKMDVSIDATRAADSAQFVSLVAHEIGHVLGIGLHSDTSSDLMFSFPTAPAPTARDAATMRWVLHQPVHLRP